LLHEIDDILTYRLALGTLAGQVEEFRALAAKAATAAADPSRAAAAALPANPPHFLRDRRAAVRLP
jgi:hypothetical protein